MHPIPEDLSPFKEAFFKTTKEAYGKFKDTVYRVEETFKERKTKEKL